MIRGATMKTGRQQVGRDRPADQEPLHLIASGVLDETELSRSLHPLRRGLDAEPAAQRHDGTDDRRTGRIIGQLADEGAIDLDAIERQMMELSQRASSRCRSRRWTA